MTHTRLSIVTMALLCCSALDGRADDFLNNLSVHGFLSVGYGRADGETVLGIPNRGTTDYRNAALQFGYALRPTDRIVIQLSHERVGVDDLSAAVLPEIALDWAFYEHRFTDRTVVKAGRVPLPVGLYNEVRDVGTLLPFYRPPTTNYSEVLLASETVDGVVLLQTVPLGKWSLEIQPFAGGWDSVATTFRARMEDVIGATVFVRTPIEGIRVGGSILRGTQFVGRPLDLPPPPPGPPRPPGPPGSSEGGRRRRDSRLASVDASFSRFSLRGEYFRDEFPSLIYSAYYGVASAKPVDKLTVNFQYSLARFEVVLPSGVTVRVPFSRDLAASVNYSPFSQVVLKLEGHEGEGTTFVGTPPVNRYFIASLAVSF
jgi:hypothetical protein